MAYTNLCMLSKDLSNHTYGTSRVPGNHEGLKIHSINSFTSAKMATALSLRQRKSTTTPKLQASVLKNRRMLISLSCFRMIVNIPALLNDFTK
ncbi:hypothetical protein ALC60_00666 [Trachymyrmex zeteki]|uniref:Uncharacterized protein n=1 Tax=Mycetomoellerius zeteki TaxID=64791 RepID=A0A151XIZ9_9HYME|nr:hypothetical protein ALC60_00666 [Trachymyrmex zeteki]